MPAYDPSNIFAKILRGELPCHKICEDDHTLVFMDIMPRVNGHALVLPKPPSRNLLDIEPGLLAPLFQMAQKVAQAAMVAFNADGISLQQFSEAAGGQVIFHTHVHILPRHEGVPLLPPGVKGDDEKIAQNAEILRDAFARLS
jgi:histidine triad (HIT) family protein